MATWPWVRWSQRLSSGQKAFLKFGMPMVVRAALNSFNFYTKNEFINEVNL